MRTEQLVLRGHHAQPGNCLDVKSTCLRGGTRECARQRVCLEAVALLERDIERQKILSVVQTMRQREQLHRVRLSPLGTEPWDHSHLEAS